MRQEEPELEHQSEVVEQTMEGWDEGTGREQRTLGEEIRSPQRRPSTTAFQESTFLLISPRSTAQFAGCRSSDPNFPTTTAPG